MPQISSLTLDPKLKGIFYVAVFVTHLLGLLNFYFDYKSKKFVQKGYLMKIYCVVVHVAYCSLLPFAATSHHIDQMAFMQRRFYVVLNRVVTILRFPSILLTLWGIWRYNGRLFKVISGLERLRLDNFHTLSEAKRHEILKRNDLLIWLKLATALSLMAMLYVRIFLFADNPTFPLILLAVYFGFLESLTIFNINFFFCGICYVNCALRYVQAEIMESSTNNTIPRKIHHLSKVIEEICHLTRELIGIFQWQLLAIMLADMVALVSLFFNIIIWWYTSVEPFKLPLLLLTLQASFINIGEIFLTAFICSDAKKCWKSIRQLLFESATRNGASRDNVEEKDLELFSLKMCVYQDNTNICGFFDLDMRTAFNFLQATAINLILLVQFDLKTS
ncbi:gustatory and pheromone receptor 39a-like [Stomoxys calcitrans]|uniref:gustatory and pheromone receptor 39a-like n=1 Tax=Stomoxys calcitrans TaxID=35570 RepID=UPI0027E340F0|nr:gustatory and pheromone receptor 39a-like [Stomoxys calcitrans]